MKRIYAEFLDCCREQNADSKSGVFVKIPEESNILTWVVYFGLFDTTSTIGMHISHLISNSNGQDDHIKLNMTVIFILFLLI
ncbi:hypothetical protein EON71_00265 [bacterium]|nr:MAG: hypothetical protein EON71_00265 [bacterium]